MSQITLVKAVLEFFGGAQQNQMLDESPYDRKVQISEFRELTKQDREDLRTLLIVEEGMDIAPLGTQVT